jgi:hypothetical protein
VELGLCQVSETVQLEQNESVTSGSTQPQAAQFSSEGKYRPGQDKPPDDELFAFRTAMAQSAQQEEAQPKASKANLLLIVALVIVVSVIGALLVFGGMMLLKPKTPSLYIDLGSQRYDPAGLGGRLIAQWTGNATYKFTVDPLDPSQIAGFRAVVANPPHTITFTLRLKDATDRIACQKDIVIPAAPQNAAADPAQALASRSTATGDTIQNMAGDNGQIGESVITGSLPCNLDAYRRIVAWDFYTDFPPLANQSVWLKHEDAVAAPTPKSKSGKASASRGYFALIKSLPAPIEADDVIVSDNPTMGVVATSGGHAFLVGSSVLTNPALDWQIFPSEIHYRCEKNAICMVTHLNSRTAVHAHLMR